MTSNLGHALVVAGHTIYSLTRFGENQFVDTIATYFALEAMGVIRVVTSHNSFVENGLLADVAVVTAICTDGGSIRE